MNTLLDGPYDLTFDSLQNELPKSRAGVFALGHVDARGTFRVQRVGRDERDLQERLCGMIGSGTMFKYAIVSTAKEAFDLECDLFHKFRPPSNIMHPDRPRGSEWKCRHCHQLHF
jgi:hypothetical protein